MGVPGLVGVEDSCVENAVKLEGHVVGCDGALAGDLDR